MRNTHSKLAASFIAVLTALVVSGVSSVALADDNSNNPAAAAPKAKEVKAKPGETVVVEDGDTVVIDTSTSAPVAKDKSAPKAKEVKANNTSAAQANDEFKTDTKSAGAKDQSKSTTTIMEDDFSTKPGAEEEADKDSVVELALRGVLSPTGPAIGGTLGFSWRFANRFRFYTGFNAGKGILDLKGQEKELLQLGFTAGISRVVTKTVEIGLFGTASWSYRDMTKDISASFFGAGPGFRVNKFAGAVFFEAGLPIGFSKKFATGDLEWNLALQASAGFHF